MARFAFRLQRVMSLREAQAKQARVRAAEAASAVLDCEQRLAEAGAVARLAAHQLTAPAHAGTVVRGGDLQAAAQYLSAVQGQLAGAASDLAQAETIRAQAIALARQAWGDAEALNTLRARRLKTWETGEQNSEQRLIDDLTAGRRDGGAGR